MTDAERRFWQAVRDRRLGDFKLRRQVPIGRWIADFACLEIAVVVEIDGGQHAESRRDAVRDQELAALGFTVIRFWNNDVLTNLTGVLDGLLARLDARRAEVTTFGESPRKPSPRRGEGSGP